MVTDLNKEISQNKIPKGLQAMPESWRITEQAGRLSQPRLPHIWHTAQPQLLFSKVQLWVGPVTPRKLRF